MTERDNTIPQRNKSEEDHHRFSEAHYQLAIEEAGIGLWDWDLCQDQQVWTGQCKTLFGLASEDEVNYALFLSLLHPADRERVDGMVEKSLTNRTEYETEYRVIWPDGSLHWICARGHGIYDHSGMPVRMIGVTFDITGRKKLEEAQQYEEKTPAVFRPNNCALPWSRAIWPRLSMIQWPMFGIFWKTGAAFICDYPNRALFPLW